MGTPIHWLSATFTSDASEKDLVKSRSLNTTRIAAVVVPVLTGIATSISAVRDVQPFDEPDFQRQLILALIGLIAFVSIADIFGRAIAASKSQIPVATLFPEPIKASKDVPKAHDTEGHVVAFRSLSIDGTSGDSEFLFIAEDGTASWETGINLRT